MTKWINKLPPEGIKACTAELQGLGLDESQIRSCLNSQRPFQLYELALMKLLKKSLQETRQIIQDLEMYGLIEIKKQGVKNDADKS